MKKIRLFATLLILFIFLTCCKEKNDDKSNKSIEFDISKHVVEVDEGMNSSVIISFAGDVMLHMPIVKAHYDNESKQYDFKPIFKFIKLINDEVDLSVANLETVINPEAPLSGFPLFNSPGEIIEALNYSGYDVIGTANNHAYDQGYTGVQNTINAILKEELTYMGTNISMDEVRARIMEINDIKLGFLCYTYGLNGFIQTEDFHVNVLDEIKLSEDINHLKNQNVDKIILFVHWGTEYRTEPSEYMKKMANIAFDLGVDYIVGSHPHVVSRVEYHGEDNERFVAYSLGNHLSNQRTEYIHRIGTEDGLIVKIKLEKDYSTKKVNLVSLETIPTWLNRYYDGKWHYTIIPIDMALSGNLSELTLTESLRNKLLESKERTENILNIN